VIPPTNKQLMVLNRLVFFHVWHPLAPARHLSEHVLGINTAPTASGAPITALESLQWFEFQEAHLLMMINHHQISRKTTDGGQCDW
jgi:hypothetical protein